MGYAEEAKFSLAEAVRGLHDVPDVRLRVAQVEATLAVLQAVDGLSSQVAYLSELLEERRLGNT